MGQLRFRENTLHFAQGAHDRILGLPDVCSKWTYVNISVNIHICLSTYVKLKGVAVGCDKPVKGHICRQTTAYVDIIVDTCRVRCVILNHGRKATYVDSYVDIKVCMSTYVDIGVQQKQAQHEVFMLTYMLTYIKACRHKMSTDVFSVDRTKLLC